MLRFERITYKHSGNCNRILSDQIELLIIGDNEFAEVDFCLE